MLESFLNTLAGMGVEWRLLCMQAVNFGIVAAILYYFLFRPVLKMMDERKRKIEDGLAYAEAMQKKLAEAEAKEAEVLNAARKTAQEIVEKARAAATAYEESQSKETAARVEQMLSKAKEAIEMEKRRQFEELKGEVSRLVVLTTGKLLSRDLSAEERKSLNTRAAEELARSN
jgi:F-type H+-transporting ATPase subunit b